MLPEANTVPTIPEAAEESRAVLLPDLSTNWFKDQTVLSHVRDSIIPLVDWTRTQRQGLHKEWDEVRNMALQQHDDNRRYLGRSQVYLPAYARARTTLVSQLSRGLFPSDEYMDVTPQDNNTADAEEAKGVKALLQCEFEHTARVRHNMKPLLRSLIDTGVGVGKFWYAKEEVSRKRVVPSLGGNQYQSIYEQEGCRFKARSLYGWHIFPITADSLEEAQMVFEDIAVPKSVLEARKRAGIWPDADEALAQPPPEMTADLQELLTAQADMASPLHDPTADTNAYGVRVVTEVWTSMVLPKRAYAVGENTDMPVPVKISLARHHVLEVRRNPFWHQRSPYLYTRDEWEPGSFYPRGQGHRVKGLQHILNDFANQSNDNGTYSLNPMVFVNPSLLSGPLTAIKPGGIWQMTDTANGARFDRPPIEQLQYGFQFLNLYQGMLMDHIGAPPIIQGMGGGKNAKTATGSQILQKNAMNPLQDSTEDIEQDILQPLLELFYILNQQYRDEESMNNIAGTTVKVPKDALLGRYAFRWLASSQAANQQQRAFQVMQLLQIIMPMIPLLQQVGYKVNPVPLLKRLYSDGFGFRNFDEFIQQGTQQGMVQGPGAPPNVMGGPGMRPRSAMEQAGGEPMEAVPGEAEDFMNVRQNADGLAAMQGGFNFGGEE